jgi:hypothetical protein
VNTKSADFLKKPTIKEAELIEGVDTIVFDKLTPEGANLSVQYAMKAGDLVQAWGISNPPYDEMKIVHEGATALSFKVGKDYFKGKRSVIFQYFLRGDDDSVIGISEGARYAVTGSIPELLPVPMVEEAVPSAGDPNHYTITLSDLPDDGATLVVNYPGIKVGDLVQTLLDPKYSDYMETKAVTSGGGLTFKMPKAYYEEVIAAGDRMTYHQYALVTTDGDRINYSRIQLYSLE